MDNCTKDCIEIMGHLKADEMCQFTQQQCVQDTIQFVQMYYCTFHSSFILLTFLGVPLFYLLFQTLNNLTEFYLTPSVDEFIEKFKISPTFAGVTFLAFANGAPDVLTAIVAGSSDSDTTVLIPFGSIFGACLFSTAFILSAVIFSLQNKTLSVKRKEILIPLGFYIIGIFFLILVSIVYGKMNLYIASALIVIYIIFIIIIVKSERKKKKALKQNLISIVTDSDLSEKPSQIAQRNSSQSNQPKGFMGKLNDKVQQGQIILFSYLIPPFTIDQWAPVKTVISLAISPVVMALTQDPTTIFTSKIGPIPIFLLICIPSILFLIHTGFCIITQRKPKIIIVYTFYSFIITIAWLTLLCSVLINLLELLQLLSDINPVFLGLTCLAWANCIGDYLSIVKFARNGNAETAVNGIFSGQLFNFLIGFGCSLFIQSMNGEYDFVIFKIQGETFDVLSDSIIMLVISAGFIYLVYIFITVARLKGILGEREGKISRLYYYGFLVFAILLAIMTDFFNELSCDM